MSAKPALNPSPAPPPAPGATSAPEGIAIGVAPLVLPQAETLVFDAAPVFSQTGGMLSVTLTARRYLPDGRGGIVEQDAVVGFLRCGLNGAHALHKALDAAILLARPTQGTGKN